MRFSLNQARVPQFHGAYRQRFRASLHIESPYHVAGVIQNDPRGVGIRSIDNHLNGAVRFAAIFRANPELISSAAFMSPLIEQIADFLLRLKYRFGQTLK